MVAIAAFEAKTRFGELLDRVIAGEEIIITRHEKPVARIIPQGRPRLEATQRAAAGLAALQGQIAAYCAGKPQASWEQFKSFVEERRRRATPSWPIPRSASAGSTPVKRRT